MNRPKFRKRSNVNWALEWQEHAPNFANGYAHVDLSVYGAKGSLRLHPGGGFGDGSHPTTRLVLRLMASRVHGRNVIDIGCGSGILSLASLVWGANFAVGVDIDGEALEHAKRNSQLNQLSQIRFGYEISREMGNNSLIVMNMISSEQRVAWNEHCFLYPLSCSVITSGILLAEREYYLKEVAVERGWHLVEELQEGDWLAFVFEQKKQSD